MNIQRSISLLFAFLALSHAVPAGDGQADLVEKAKSVFDFQSHLRGDPDAGVEFALFRVRDLDGTPLSELSMRMALMQDPAEFSAVDVGEADARRLITADPPLPPEIVDLARCYVARAMTHSGRQADARQIHRQRGLAMEWSVAGPFPSLHPNLFGIPELPRTECLDPESALRDPPGAEDFQRWLRSPPRRPVPESAAIPVLRPWRWLGRTGDGAVLLETSLNMEEADPRAAFHLWINVSWTMYLDGAAVAAVNRDRAEAPLEHAVELPLSRGWHDVVLLLAPPSDASDRSESGAALRLASSSAFSWAAAAPERVVPTPPARLREARRPRYMMELAAAANQDPALRAAYAVSCFDQGMHNEAAWHAALAARVNQENINLLVLAGDYAMRDPLTPGERRGDMASAWYRRALSLRDDLAPALLFFARRAGEAGRGAEARDYLDRAFNANPKSLQVLLARARWASSFLPPAASRALLEECAEAFPSSLVVRRENAALPFGEYWDLERRVAACRAAVSAGDVTPESAMLLGEALADSGDVQAAASAVRDALAAFPDDLSVLVWAADVYARILLYEDAVRTVEQALRLTPDRPSLWRLLGDLSREMGRKEEAVGYWRTSLAGDPGQRDLADMLHALSDDQGRNYFDGGYDAEKLVREVDASLHSGDIVRILDRSVVSMSRDGSYRRLTHEIDLALTRRGGDILADIRPRGELLTARTIFPDGETLDPEPFPGHSGLRLPTLLPGAARELQFLETVPAGDGVPAPISAWYFQDPSGRTPLLTSEYVVRVPRFFPLVHSLRAFGREVEFEKTVEGAEDVYRWTARLGLSPDEPDAVHVSERLPFVEIGAAVTWEVVTQGILRRLTSRLTPGRGMLALLSSLRTMDGDAVDLENTARAIYRFVCDNIEAVSGPEMAAHVLADRRGDPTLLLLAMLRAAGFDAHPAAARPRRALEPPPNWELPNPDIFTVPLVRLTLSGAAAPFWLDCRFRTLPFGVIADDLSDASVIAYLPEGPIFSSLPVLPASGSTLTEERRIILPDGPGKVARVVGRTVLRGVAGLSRRQFMADADPQARRLAVLESLTPVFPDALLLRTDVQQDAPPASESRERYEIESAGAVAERSNGSLAAELCLAAPRLVSPASRNLTKRLTVCHIAKERILEDVNSFILPGGWRFSRLPESVNIPSNFGAYQLRVTRRGPSQVDVTRICRFPAARIEPWEWADFLLFLDRVDLAESQWIEYEKTPSE
ncbi:MAG: tetratricopeptide repeat protein [Planctomycetota bacterium]|jgi:tetratricopeptide (TPR) repeat protein|nr:tetratricopeptide repeat protein [Planctomycetota bacterium]